MEYSSLLNQPVLDSVLDDAFQGNIRYVSVPWYHDRPWAEFGIESSFSFSFVELDFAISAQKV